MTTLATTAPAILAPPRRNAGTANWLVPLGLLALAFIPIAAGAFRLTTLVGHTEITAENARFFASPLPVILHIVSVSLFSILGAFQFSPGLRRRWPAWHRTAGRVIVVAGLVAALSGLWMATFYAIVPADNMLLHGFRLIFGAAMAACIVVGFVAIRRGNVAAHQAWMGRAYAIGLGAGTQSLTQIPLIMAFGKLDPMPLALAMGSAWFFNLAVAEWLIRRRRNRGFKSWGTNPGLGTLGILVPGKWLPLRTLGWAAATVFAIMLVFGLVTDAASHWLPPLAPLQFLIRAGGALTVLATYAALVKVGERRWPGELAASAAPLDTLAGLAIGLVMFSVVMAILVASGAYEINYHGPAVAWHGAGLAVESAVVEEVLVRGIVLRLMWRAFGPVTAFAISAALFGLGHVGNPGATAFTTACVALEAGVMLGSFYALTGRLWVSIGVHAGWNFAQGYLFGAKVSGGDFGEAIATSAPLNGRPDWLTGGIFGPEASLPALVICLTVGVAILWLAARGSRHSKAG